MVCLGDVGSVHGEHHTHSIPRAHEKYHLQFVNECFRVSNLHDDPVLRTLPADIDNHYEDVLRFTRYRVTLKTILHVNCFATQVKFEADGQVDVQHIPVWVFPKF